MQVILLKDVDQLGGNNDLVTVKMGYARNYLLPQGLAVEASHSNKKQMEERQKHIQKKEEKLIAEISKLKAALAEGPLTIGAKTGTSGKIFGTITTLQLVRAIRDQKGFEIDRKRIVLTEEIKEIGSYKATLDFGNGTKADVDFNVIGE